ncbi:DNA-binding domain-containing protein [Maricaulis sp.]|uniref:HvfC/BufC N-terminal domain-containing protein n=1 Tax=Maricaulis sp. TaxID=1486257 RepID=UPI003A95DAC2
MPDHFHEDFAAAIRSGDPAAIEARLTTPVALRRMAVYRNNVVHGITEALRSAYPAVARLVGAEFFASMARAYWEVSPPAEPSLSLYGAGFADFITGYAPAADLVYLADIARLDRAWLEAHHASDFPALDPGRIAGLPPHDLPNLAPGLHPSVSLWSSPWPVYEIWRRNREASEPVGTVVLRPEPASALVWRHRGVVRHRALTPGEQAFFTALAQGQNLEAAAEHLLSLDPAGDAAALFGEALTHSILKGNTP